MNSISQTTGQTTTYVTNFINFRKTSCVRILEQRVVIAYHSFMKILVTGAHFTPALATAEELLKKDGVEIVYVGRDTTLEGDNTPSVESKIIPALDIKFIPITTGRLQKAFTPYTILSIFKIPVGFIQALVIILSEKPDVILSFGGYVALPLVIMGWLFSIPVIIHEQTLVSGLANRISALFANKIALSFKNGPLRPRSEASRVDGRTIITGNPIRRMILDVKLTHPRGVVRRHRLTILITGGNQGSHVINLAVEEALDKLTKIASVIHVTGDNKFKDFERLKRLEGLEGSYLVKKWIGEDWGKVLSKADLVVSRAGVNTLTEMAYLGKPGLVIPIPYLYLDEQNKNAKFFGRLGLVRVLSQSGLSAVSLLGNIKWMIRNLDDLKQKAKNAKKAVIPDAAKRLALETLLLGKRYN